MPKIGKKQPVDLNGRKIVDEMFHLERTISNSDRMNADLIEAVDGLGRTIDTLNDHVESLISVMEEVRDLLKKKGDDA